MSKLILLILLPLISIRPASGQAIYELVHDKQVKGHIVGSAHDKIRGISHRYFKLVEEVIAKSDALLIESIPSKQPDIVAREKLYASQGITLRILAEKENHECLQTLIRDWDAKWKMPLSYLIDWGPAAFFHTFVQAVFSSEVGQRDHVNSLDSHIYKSFLNRYSIIELEGWTGTVEASLKLDPEEYGRTAEAYCKVSTAPGYPQKQHLADVRLLMNALEKGENDQFRRHYEFIQKQIGWSDKTLYQNLGYRDRKNAKAIHEHLQSGKHKSPMIVVGAVHLGGADGLLNNLRSMGYTVQQYRPDQK